MKEKTSRIGAIIIQTAQGKKVLFPKNRITNPSQEELGDLRREVDEENRFEEYTAQGMSSQKARDKAHDEAIKSRDNFIRGGIEFGRSGLDIEISQRFKQNYSLETIHKFQTASGLKIKAVRAKGLDMDEFLENEEESEAHLP
ncbi:MAG: hypothetical protein ABIK26_07225 [Candidatus Omnitrophota bacterium]